MLINREPFKVDIPPRSKARLNRTRNVNGALEPHPLHPVLDHLEVDSNHTSHLDSAAEGNLAIALRKVQITHTELSSRHMDGQVNLGAPAQVLDIAVPSMLRPSGDRSRALLADLLRNFVAGRAGVHVDGLRQMSHLAVGKLVSSHQLALALVPRGQHLGRGRATDDARVDQAGELDAGDVARGGVDAFEVPDGFGG